METNIYTNQYNIVRFLSIPIQSNGPSYVFKYTASKAKKGSNQAWMHFLPSEISEWAADTQCGVAGPLKVLQHPASVCQTTGPRTQHCCSLSLTSTQRKPQFPQHEESKIGADTHLVRCDHQQAFISHTLPVPDGHARNMASPAFGGQHHRM